MNRFFLSVLLPVCSALMLGAANPPVAVDLWPDGAPNDNGILADAEAESNQFVTSVSKPVIYVYPASEPNGTAIVMLPGGGYSGLAMYHEGTDMADWLNSMGITYAVLKYRMPNGHVDVPLSDAEQAMRIMRSHAAEWGVNPSSVGIMGASAGGHLATTLATHYTSDETRPDFQVLFYPVVSMRDDITHQYSRAMLMGENPTAEQIDGLSNELQVNARTPNAFIMLSADDDAVPVANSLRYFQALTDAGVLSAMHVYPSGGHGWGYRDSFPYKSDWKSELQDWLRREVIGKK